MTAATRGSLMRGTVMHELIKKDFMFLLSFLVAGIVANTVLLFDFGFETLWVLDNSRYWEHAFVIHFLFGICLGAFLAIRDEVPQLPLRRQSWPVGIQLVL